MENPPLARALHATVEVDQEIPPEHYKAVAEVIGYVMKLRRACAVMGAIPVAAGFGGRACAKPLRDPPG